LAAQADGDLKTLLSLGRSVCRVNLGVDTNKGLKDLICYVEGINFQK